MAAVAAGAVVAARVSGSDDAVTLVATITLVTGVLFLLLAIFKMGWISQFLSKAVITGFLFGAAIEVVIGELPKQELAKVGIQAVAVSGPIEAALAKTHDTVCEGGCGGRKECKHA